MNQEDPLTIKPLTGNQKTALSTLGNIALERTRAEKRPMIALASPSISPSAGEQAVILIAVASGESCVLIEGIIRGSTQQEEWKQPIPRLGTFAFHSEIDILDVPGAP